MNCSICGKLIEGEYLQSKVDKDLKPTDEGDIVCSKECMTKYEAKLVYGGKPMDHYSRITGYYQNVSGWNAGKLQELKERRKYGIKE